MIPKKIHYFWFGKGEKSQLTKFCIESWKKYLPDFEIIEWTEENFDTTSNVFIREAYEQKNGHLFLIMLVQKFYLKKVDFI